MKIDPAAIARAQDEVTTILMRLAAVTPAMRVAGDTEGIVAAVNEAWREIEAVLEAGSQIQ